MSWASDIGDWIGGSSTGGASGWVDTNSSWLKPVVNLVGGAMSQTNSDNAQSQYIDYLKANGLPKRKEDREVIIMRIIDHEFDYICQASSEDLKDQFAIWKQLLNTSS